MKKYSKKIQKKLGLELPKHLVKLIEFVNTLEDKYKYDMTNFSSDFKLEYNKELIEDYFWDRVEDENSSVSYKTIKKVSKKLIPFANLHKGSVTSVGEFAFWLKDNETADNLPIVSVCHNNGYMELFAKNTKELLRLLSAGAPSWILNEGDLPFVNLNALEDYRNWLQTELNIEPLKTDKEVKAIKQEAQDLHQEAFYEWLTQNGSDHHVKDDIWK